MVSRSGKFFSETGEKCLDYGRNAYLYLPFSRKMNIFAWDKRFYGYTVGRLYGYTAIASISAIKAIPAIVTLTQNLQPKTTKPPNH